MKIGIIADTHDNLGKIKTAVRILKEKNISYLLHCGDFVAPFTIPYLKEGNFKKIIAVFGNNDGEKLGLKKSFEGIGEICKAPFHLTLEKFKILILHEPLEIEMMKIAPYNLIVYGHTHSASIIENNNSLIVNPGECGGWTSGKSTIAIADLGEKKAKIINIDKF